MTAKIEIQMDSAAFTHEPGEELARILRKLADNLDGADITPADSNKLRDVNGNTVGTFTVTD